MSTTVKTISIRRKEKEAVPVLIPLLLGGGLLFWLLGKRTPPGLDEIPATNPAIYQAVIEGDFTAQGRIYNDVQQASDAQKVHDNIATGWNYLNVGQEYDGVYDRFDVFRGVVGFDTRKLSKVKLVSQKLELSVQNPLSAELVVVNGSGIDNPLVPADYGLLYNRNAVLGKLPANLTGTVEIPLAASAINKSGTTVLGLRDQRDIGAVMPTGFSSGSVAMIWGSNWSGIAYAPKLVVEWEL